MSATKGNTEALSRLLATTWPLHWIGRVLDHVLEWRRRHRSRRQLNAMSDHMCKDIGISRADAWREGRKPFWKA